MDKAFKNLWEFHEVYDCARSNIPALPDQATRDLRMRIIQEEFDELKEAEAQNDLVEIADALADIVYLAIGQAVSYGIPLDKVFAEVHASNMSKLGEDGKPIRRADGKVLKGPAFKEPNIAKILADEAKNPRTFVMKEEDDSWAKDHSSARYDRYEDDNDTGGC